MKPAVPTTASSPVNASSGSAPLAAAAGPSLLGSLRAFLRRALRHSESSLKEVIEEAIEEHEEQTADPLEPEEKIMLHNVLSFSDIKVGDIMIPRADIAAVGSDIDAAGLRRHIAEQRHTRIPVYEDTLDKVLGFVHVKDLIPMLAGGEPYELRRVIRPLLFVPPSMRIIDLLVRMRGAGSHMAIVVDEYGGTDGLITMENLFEEIVGDIQDEHDEEEQIESRILRVSENVYEVSARIPIDRLEQELGLGLVTEEKEGEFDTLGGLIFFQLGRVPPRGEIIPQPSGARFEIVDADPRRIRKVRIHQR